MPHMAADTSQYVPEPSPLNAHHMHQETQKAAADAVNKHLSPVPIAASNKEEAFALAVIEPAISELAVVQSPDDDNLQSISNVNVTPRARPMKRIDQSYYSEPRHVQAPVLRTRRHQSISTMVESTSSVVDWLNRTPGGGDTTTGFSSPASRQASPTKHESAMKSLRTIDESGDPFTTPPRAKGKTSTAIVGPISCATDNFLPITVTLANSRLLYNGMSPQLYNLTRGGTCMPSAEEALHLDNLPFIETCRTIIPKNYGVIKLVGVS